MKAWITIYNGGENYFATKELAYDSTPFSPPSGPLMSFLKGLHPKSNSLAIVLE